MKKRNNNNAKHYSRNNNYSKTRSKDVDVNKDTTGSKFDNDVSWYGKNPQLIRDAASLNFSNVVGSPFELTDNKPGVTPLGSVQSVPGIVTIQYIPSIGMVGENSSSDPINTAGKNIYSFVRHANSGARNYEWQDLTMTILAASQVFSAIALAARAYGVARVYNQKNKYQSEALLRAMGFDPSSVLNNLANFRYSLNNAIAKASVIWVPKDMPIVARQFWMNSNIYKDANTDKAQFYMYVPWRFWKWDATTSTEGTSLQLEPWPTFSVGHSFSDIIDLINRLLEPLIADEDTGIMFGDLKKAYGDNLYKIDMIPEDYTVLPVYNEEVLMQIHNTVALRVTPTPVLQNSNGLIYCDPYTMDTSDSLTLSKCILDFKGNLPSPESVMVGTRMTALVTGVKPDNTFIITSGTEVAREFYIWYYDENGTLQATWLSSFDSQSIAGDHLREISLFTRFDWAPYIYKLTKDNPADYTQVGTLDAIIGDVEYFTCIDPYTLKKMHTTALLSEFNVPAL